MPDGAGLRLHKRPFTKGMLNHINGNSVIIFNFKSGNEQ